MKRLTVLLAALVGSVALMSSAEATVLRVVVVEATDAAGYLGDLQKIRGVMQRLGSSTTLRAWRARFAGPNAGTIVVAIEYPDMATFAAEDAKTSKDSEYVALIKGLDAKRKIVSDSLYEELK